MESIPCRPNGNNGRRPKQMVGSGVSEPRARAVSFKPFLEKRDERACLAPKQKREEGTVDPPWSLRIRKNFCCM